MKIRIKIFIFMLFTLFCLQTMAAEYNVINDQTITQEVKKQIAANKTVSGLSVGVDTQNRIVKLNGRVNTDTQASTLIEIASSVEGVKDVDNSQLMVKESKHPLNDTVITAKVKGAFIREKLFTTADVSAMSISVETKNGIVYLTGSADNQTQIDNAIQLARSIKGVKSVDSKVTIK